MRQPNAIASILHLSIGFACVAFPSFFPWLPVTPLLPLLLATATSTLLLYHTPFGLQLLAAAAATSCFLLFHAAVAATLWPLLLLLALSNCTCSCRLQAGEDCSAQKLFECLIGDTGGATLQLYKPGTLQHVVPNTTLPLYNSKLQAATG
jgi:hypothetical protein